MFRAHVVRLRVRALIVTGFPHESPFPHQKLLDTVLSSLTPVQAAAVRCRLQQSRRDVKELSRYGLGVRVYLNSEPVNGFVACVCLHSAVTTFFPTLFL